MLCTSYRWLWAKKKIKTHKIETYFNVLYHLKIKLIEIGEQWFESLIILLFFFFILLVVLKFTRNKIRCKEKKKTRRKFFKSPEWYFHWFWILCFIFYFFWCANEIYVFSIRLKQQPGDTFTKFFEKCKIHMRWLADQMRSGKSNEWACIAAKKKK